jgi:hypothetical protein
MNHARLAAAALLAAGVPAQADAPAVPDVLTEQRVRETVAWLADDERAGRDTGSAELAAAGEWIAARFAAAGLGQVREGAWTHEFTLQGWLLDQTALQVTLVRTEGETRREFVLAPDADVRQWTVAAVTAGADEPATVGLAGDAVLQRMLQARSARRPVVLEVGADHPYWTRSAGQHQVVENRRQASHPVLLVRHGVLPAVAPDANVDWTITWNAPAPRRADVPQHNLVAVRRGTTKADEYVVVSAHYDHVGIGQAVAGDTIYNGADDNATGTTAVLLLAEALAKEPLARSVLFVCFTGEERGLLGSKAFCERPPVPLERIVANLNLEMLGRPEPGAEGKAWITGHDLSDFAAIAEPALARAGVGVIPFAMHSRLFQASDNWSFAQRGVVAHSVSAGSLHEDYHRPGDEVDKLDVAHMTRIVRGLRELVVELANRDQPPAWNEAGKTRLQRRGR